MPRTKPDFDDAICAATLRLAAREGWRKLTLDTIAKAAKVKPAELRARFTDKTHLLPGIAGWIDRQAAERTGKINPADTPHDRLFEVMMARFDVLQEHRKAILDMIEEVRANPRLARHIVPAQAKAIKDMIERAHLAPSPIPSPLVCAALLAIYYRALHEWRRDTTHDMSKTMANLDRSLRHAGKAAEILFRAVGAPIAL